MTVLPIVEATLRQASRRPRTYWSRVLAVALPSLFLFPLLYLLPVGFGRPFAGSFVGFAPWLIIHLLSVSARATSDAIAKEKREGTLGLLFLTDLKGHDIVLGKLSASCAQLFASWLAMMPLACILILAGGVTWLGVLLFMLAIGNTLFFGAAAGILASAIHREQKRALGAATAYVLTSGILLPIAGFILRSATDFTTLGAAMLEASPGPAILTSFGWSFSGGRTVWISLLIPNLWAWGMIGLASWFAPRRWQDKPVRQPREKEAASPAPLPVSEPSRPDSLPLFPTTPRRMRDRTLLNENPFAWLVSRKTGSCLEYTVAIILTIGLGVLLWKLDLKAIAFELCMGGIGLAFAVHAVLKFNIGEGATRGIHEQKTGGALEHLLVTRLTPDDVIEGQRLELRRVFRRAVLGVLAFDFAVLAYTLFRSIATDGASHSSGDWRLLSAGWAYLIVALLADLPALFWTGIWEALRSRKKWEKTRQNAFAIVNLTPLISTSILSAAIISLGSPRLDPFWTVAGVWLAASLITNIFCVWVFRRVTRRRFRKLARESAGPQDSNAD